MKKLKEHISNWMRSPRFTRDGEQVTSGIGLDGLEYPDPVPFAPDAGLNPPESQADMIMRLMRDARLREAAELEGFDTEEEADDFDIEDDPVDATTPWEEPYLPPKPVRKAAEKPADAPPPAPPSPATPSSVATPEAPVVAVPPPASPQPQ